MNTCPRVTSKEWLANVEAVGEFQTWRDYYEYGDVRETNLIEEKLETVIPVITKVQVYQGSNTNTDTRDFNYFTENKDEAKDYGNNVREFKIDTTGFLFAGNDNYYNLIREEKALNKEKDSFSIEDNSKEGLHRQKQFFDFLQTKGYKGLGPSPNTIDSRYYVTFNQTNNLTSVVNLHTGILTEPKYIVASDAKQLLKDIISITKNDGTRVLAKALLNVPNLNKIQLKVVDARDAEVTFGKSKIEGGKILGDYSSNNKLNILKTLNNEDFETVFLHEMIHGITGNLYRTDKDFQHNINGLYSYVLSKYGDTITLAGIPLKEMYGMTDEHEFMAVGMSDPIFITELQKIYSPLIKAGENQNENIFSKFLNFVVEALTQYLKRKNKENNIASQSIHKHLVNLIGTYGKIIETTNQVSTSNYENSNTNENNLEFEFVPLDGNESLYKYYKLLTTTGKIQSVKSGKATDERLLSLNRSPYYKFALTKTTDGLKILIKRLVNSNISSNVVNRQSDNTQTNEEKISEQALREQQQRENNQDDEFKYFKDALNDTPTTLANENTQAIEIATKIADSLVTQLGLQYELLSDEQALKLNPNWKGEAGFSRNGIQYFVRSRMTTNLAFHEFSHPLLQAINKTNPKLFASLFNQLSQTPEGQKIIEQVKNEDYGYDENSDDFKEECIVRALANSAETQYNNEKEPKGFAKVIRDILYSIKQLFRKIFGQKVDVSKLDASTSIERIAEMLAKGENFEIISEHVTKDDIARYFKDRVEEIEAITTIANKDYSKVQGWIDSTHNAITRHLDALKKSGKLSDLEQKLNEQYSETNLQDVKNPLTRFTSKTVNKMDKLKMDVDHEAKAVSALVNSLFRIDLVIDKMYDNSQSLLPEKGDTEEDIKGKLAKSIYYKALMTSWKTDVVDVGLNALTRDIPINHPIRLLLNKIDNTISEINKTIHKMQMPAVRDTLVTVLGNVSQAADQKYNDEIARLKKAGAAPWRIKLEEDEYKKIKLTPEKLEKLLTGEEGDANFANSILEGYLYNNDPVIGGLALYTKDAYTDIMVKSQSKYNQFISDTEALYKELGYDPKKIAEFNKQFLFLDNVGEIVDGKVEDKFVWRYLNEFKDSDHAVKKWKNDIKKLNDKFLESGDDEDRKALVLKEYQFKRWMENNFHGKYTPAFYDRMALLEQDEIGIEAASRRNLILDEMSRITDANISPSDLFAVTPQLDALWRDYKRLSATKDINGDDKVDEYTNDKGEKIVTNDLAIALRLKEYQKAGKDFYTRVDFPQMFQNALDNYLQSLIDKGEGFERGSVNYNLHKREWIKKNTRAVIKPSFYARRRELLDKLFALVGSQNEDVKKAYDEISEITAGYRDDDGQLIGSEMSDRIIQLVKKQQLIIEDLKNLPKQNKAKLNRLERQQLEIIIAQLKDLSSTDATEYYLDAINNQLRGLDAKTEKKLKRVTKTGILTVDSVDILLKNKGLLNALFTAKPSFKVWFEKNHFEKAVKLEYGSQEEPYDEWQRVQVWNIVRPNDEEYLETTVVKDEDGNDVEIPGLLGNRYTKMEVKPEYLTEKIVGKTVDNSNHRNNWLPRTDVKDSPFINLRYQALKNAPADTREGKVFELLEILKKHHLANQEGLSDSKKLYLDHARFEKDTLEKLQTKGYASRKMSALSIYINNIKQFFTRVKEDPDAGTNSKEDFAVDSLDLLDNDVAKVPIRGLFNYDEQEVSLDIRRSMMKYMLSAEENKKLTEILPFVQALKNTLADPDYAKKMAKFNAEHRTILGGKKKDRNVRVNSVKNWIEKTFEGQTRTGFLSDSPFANNLFSMLAGRASMGFFALNATSAIKNSIGAKFQGMLEAIAGEHMNLKDYAKAEVTATNVMMQMSANVYTQTNKPLFLQMIEVFDAIQGRFEDKFGEGQSRSLLGDTVNMSWMYNFRKWTENQATLQLFFGMMHHEKVKQNGVDIDYIDAWQLKDGKIQLKDGIDAKYGITYDKDGNVQIGSEFKRIKNKMESVSRDVNGAYDKFNQPELSRYLLFRFVAFLRKFFTTMLMNRFGFAGSIRRPMPRMNVGFGAPKMGFYVTFLRSVARTIAGGMKGNNYLLTASKEEKRAGLKILGEIGALVTISMLMGPLFGWDPDDEERYEKLRQKSGALPFFGLTADDPEHPFHLGGWLSNHSLSMMMQVRAENEQFLPFPGFGLDDYSAYLDMKSLVAGPTIKKYGTIMSDLTNLGNEKGYYQRDIGPLQYQEQGDAKIWNHLFSTFGLSGSNIDANMAIRNFQSVQARNR